MPKLLHPMLKISPREVEFTRRGFTCASAAVRKRLEHAGRTFLHGYNSALDEEDQMALAAQLDAIDAEYTGFAWEGAAMALAILDGISPWAHRFERFVTGAGRRHVYMVYVGAGWACARLPWLRWRIQSVIQRFHPVLRWLVVDGYGFHEGFFHHETTIALKKIPAHLSPEARHVFCQGLGRSLWFVNGANPSLIFRTIGNFGPQHQADAWSGVGLACAYAGGIQLSEIEELRWLAGEHSPALAQGSAFAAKARQLAGNPAAHTELACKTLCGMNAARAAALCDETFSQLDHVHPFPYRQWRELLQKSFVPSVEMRGKPNEFPAQLVTSKPA